MSFTSIAPSHALNLFLTQHTLSCPNLGHKPKNRVVTMNWNFFFGFNVKNLQDKLWSLGSSKRLFIILKNVWQWGSGIISLREFATNSWNIFHPKSSKQGRKKHLSLMEICNDKFKYSLFIKFQTRKNISCIKKFMAMTWTTFYLESWRSLWEGRCNIFHQGSL
jgi:hypothetical protein